MKSWARELALGLLLATAIPSAASLGAQSAEQILLDKANYWRLKDRPDLAIEALQKLLSINPNNPDALYQYGILEVQQNKLDEAKGYLGRLRKADASSPRIADLENAIRAGQVSPNELSEARRLAQAGQFSQAAKKYEQTFQGPPPPTFGIEYYMTLAGTPQGWAEARRGLERLVQESPNDSRAKLSLAEVLTYHSETRNQGIRQLSQLADDPVVGSQATQSWKKALGWLGNGPEDRRLYDQYVAKFGQDQDLRQHIAEATKQSAPGPAGPASGSALGYGDLNRGNLAAAERQFEAMLRRNPADADAIAGIGLIRLRQQRFGEAREMLGRAMREAPARRGQWAAAYGSAVFWANLNEAKAAQNAGNSAAAETGYRRALEAQPDNADAIVGLYTALSAEGKTAEAATLAARIATLDPRKMAGINRARSDILRADAKSLAAQNDLAGAQAKYQESIAVDPSNAWARLDLARMLAAHGDQAQAFAVINPAASGSSAEAYQAAALFYGEQNRFQDAMAALDQIPAGSRTPDIVAFRERILITADIDRAKQLARSGNRAAARNVLMSLNSRPPASAEKTSQIAAALADIGDTQTALQLARPNAAAAATNKKAVLDYAGLLLRAGRDAEATAYLTQAEASGRITSGDRQELEHIKEDIASKRADQLRTRGDLAGAYDQISALLSAYPNDPTLLLAAGRIYAAAGENSVAMRFFDAAYQQSPGDLGTIRAAIGGAIVAGDLDRARAYLAQGMQLFPNNPRLYYMQAEISRAGGDNGAAIYDLNVARSLDTQQAGGFEPLPNLGPGSPTGRPTSLPPNPFRRSDAEVPRPRIMLAAATQIVANDGSSAPPPAAALPAAPPPLQETAISADSDDLVVPPHAGDRPPRRPAASAAFATSTPPDLAQQRRLTLLSSSADPVGAPYYSDPATQAIASPRRRQLAQLPPLAPPPVPGYQPPAGYAPAASEAPFQPMGAAPMQGYQQPAVGLPAPVPQDSLELDIERSMNAIAAESGPSIQGGLAFRERSGEDGLSRLTEVGVPIEGTFSPFYTGTMRLQAIPTFLTAGSAAPSALIRFGHEPLLAFPGATTANLIEPGSQKATGVSLNAAYSYQMFSGEVGTTPLGFPVQNFVGRLALTWPGPGGNSTVLPTIPLAPTTVANPLQVKVEAARQPITESLLSYAGTRDPVTGQIWGGVIKTGGDALVSYDDGDIGVYGGGGFWSIDGKAVASNSELEGLVGAYVRPYRVGANAFKIGVNLSYMGYDKNLRFFTFGQGGYFSPQTYLNISIPMEYSGRTGRFTYLVGGALGVQTFDESRSPVFPVEAGNQAALQNSFGGAAFYPSRSVTGLAFSAKGQVEYQLNNGFSVGGLASIDNAQNYTEGIAKLYLRKSFGPAPASAYLPNSLPGSL